MQQYAKFHVHNDKLNKEREVLAFENSLSQKLNFMIYSGKQMNAFSRTSEKIAELNHKISINNITLPTTTCVSNSCGSINGFKFNSNKTSVDANIKKEVVVENVKSTNYIINLAHKRDSSDNGHIVTNDLNYVSHRDREKNETRNSSKALNSLALGVNLQNESFNTISNVFKLCNQE